MIVRTVADVTDTDRETRTSNWVSRRLLLKRDGMPFSVHETTIFKGTETEMCYKNHVEAVFCVEGWGEVEAVATGEVFPIAPGTMYALDDHDHHILRARTSMRMVCVFNPPVTGNETHDEHGAYPLVED
jgi:L-ectoine synthase